MLGAWCFAWNPILFKTWGDFDKSSRAYSIDCSYFCRVVGIELVELDWRFT